MATYIPHTDTEIAAMLQTLGLTSLEELFSMVPEAMRLTAGLDIPDGLSEFDTVAELERLAAANTTDLVCFAGGGAYDHAIPAAVRRLAGRSEFVTSYTPYQPEVAQGVLQALFEYQSMVSRLTGLELANASLYDGATACVEALNLAVAATGRSNVIVSRGLAPNWRATLETMASGSGHELVDLPLSGGLTNWNAAGESPAGAVVVQYPNYLGCLEDLHRAREVADRLQAKLIVAFDPVAAGALRSPGSAGADVVVGEGQPFGTPMSFGGPYLGLFACTRADMRRLPGRLVGATVDTAGKKAYVTTLRTREQDIRREKASSNVCTNQTLIAVTAAIQLAWLGTSGLRELALRCARGTRYAREGLLGIPGIEPLVEASTFREFAIRTPVPPDTVVERMASEGYLAGVTLPPADYGEGLLVAVTERRTRIEIDAYVAAMEKAVR